jgi:hypothetical protein
MYWRKFFFLMVFYVLLIVTCSCNVSTEQTSTKSNNGKISSPTETSVSPPTGTELAFETIVKVDYPSTDLGAPENPEIIVTTSEPLTHIPGISPHDISPNVGSESIIKEVDYSKFIVLIAFHGTTYPESVLEDRGIDITRIQQDGNKVYIQARFQLPQPTVVPGIVYPYHIVKVNKESVIQFGKLTFVLLDQLGKERVATTCEILP